MTRPILAAVDTNVLIVMTTMRDAIDGYRRAVGLAGPDAPVPDQKEMEWLDRQAEAALRLGIYLHEANATTLSVNPELMDQFVELAPPEQPSSITRYCRLFNGFVRPHVLSGWTSLATEEPTLKADQVDREFERLALHHNCPLITFEGDTPSGINEKKKGLRRKAKALNIDVSTPAEFCAQRQFDEGAIDRFFQRFAAHAQGYADALEQSPEYRSPVKNYPHMLLHGMMQSMGLTLGKAEVVPMEKREQP